MRLNNYSRTFLFLCSPPLSAVSFLPSLTFLHPSGFPFPVLLLHFYSHCLLLSFCPPHLIISSNLISSPSPVLILLSLPFRQSFPFVSSSSSPHIIFPILFHFPFVHPLFHLSFSFISPSLHVPFSSLLSFLAYSLFSLPPTFPFLFSSFFSPVLHPVITPLPSSLSLLFLSSYLHLLSFSYFPSLVYTLSFLPSPSRRPFYCYSPFLFLFSLLFPLPSPHHHLLLSSYILSLLLIIMLSSPPSPSSLSPLLSSSSK